MKTSTPQIREKTAELASSGAWLMLFEIFSLNEVFYLVRNQTPIVFDGKTFEPFPIEIGPTTSDTKGTEQRSTLNISGVDRNIRNKIEEHDGFRGALVTVTLIHEDFLNDPLAADTEIFRVRETGKKGNQFVLQIGQHRRHLQLIGRRFSKLKCNVPYKSAQCGYQGPIVDCDKTKDGPNGCTVHGDDEVARALPRLHPRMFGAQPGILRSR